MHVHRDLDALPAFRHPVVTIGSFDGVHLGHQELLSQIRDLARDRNGESVLVTFDPHPRHVLGHQTNPLKLLTTTPEKIERIAAQGIDHVVVVPFDLTFAKQSAEAYLTEFLFGKFKPDMVVIGYDHRYGAGRKGDIHLLQAIAESRNIKVEEIQARDVDQIAVSSTRIRKAVATGQIDEANTLLGTPYPLTGVVVHGEAIGRTIGFPTANLDLQHPHKLLPADGVYAVKVHAHKGITYKAMLYIGQRPSLSGKRPRTIEVNILDFSSELYGETLHVEVIQRLRGDQEFSSLDALKEQIEADRIATISLFSIPE